MTRDAKPVDADVPACRNCGTPATMAYCPSCGQETRRGLPTLREFFREAAFRYVAFDGRLWRTLAALVARPGFLTREYFAGRRRRYIRPARLFLVMSLIVFAVIRLTVTIDDVAFDTAPAARGGAGDVEASAPEAAPGIGVAIDKERNVSIKGLPGPLAGELDKRLSQFNRMPPRVKLEQTVAGMQRYGPYAMFALLPAFAALQKLAYLGRTRRYAGRPRLYVEHLVYGAHLHTFLFLILAVALCVPSSLVRWLLAAWSAYYVLRAQHRVYGGSWKGGLARTALVGTAYLALMVPAIALLLVAAVLLR